MRVMLPTEDTHPAPPPIYLYISFPGGFSSLFISGGGDSILFCIIERWQQAVGRTCPFTFILCLQSVVI